MTFTDSHCHLPNSRHKDELETVLSNARSWDVTQFINIGTSIKENAEVMEVAEKYDPVYATVAIYPHEQLGDNINQLVGQLEKQAKSSQKVVAIGECGIDISEWKNQRPLNEQIKLFELQVELSQKLNLPLVVHNRNGDSIVLDVLLRHKGVRGVLHCFDSTWEIAQKFLNLGFYISFSGLITYQTKEHLLETVRNVPLDKYLVETDSPYLLPEPAKTEVQKAEVEKKKVWRQNEPKYVRMVGQKAAEARQISLEEVASQTSSNARQLFGLKP